ncbi:hypothetical protein [Sphingobacterium sp. DR205]|uniref:hypothetical protein n=1 Tax=Sphingobacterium sp. DR205 TaxID=2713573 RepID=UPI0019D1E528|nr:hypothetical protein [Sphingobacterium sp. DR205]
MILKIINSVLILIAVFMGIKRGYAMLSGKPEMMEMFGKWGFNKTKLAINGAITMIAALLILFPKTFVGKLFNGRRNSAHHLSASSG